MAAPLAMASAAGATHVPVALDTAVLRPDEGGYLEFINPTEFPGLIGFPVATTPPGVIETEEHTGFTTVPGDDIIEVGDSDITHGDRADFDWVQENRPDETAGPPISNHPGLVGAMGWTIGLTEASPHIDPGTGAPHDHSVAEGIPGGLPELLNPDWSGFFSAVDVFSIISSGEDFDLGGPREAALDYEVAFANSVTGAASFGVPVIVWVPGWTGATGIDDFVARWVPADPGLYDLVAIEPLCCGGAFGHDDVTEIDAVKAIPEPHTALLLAMGLLGLAQRRQLAGRMLGTSRA